MKKIEEMLADVRADQAKRQQLEQEQKQKKRDLQEAVILAEKEMQEALNRQDQDAYHAAEGRLSYARKVLSAFEAATPWWTQAEAQEIMAAAWNAYMNESREKYKEAFDLLVQIDALFSDIHRIGMIGYTISNIIETTTKIPYYYSFYTNRSTLPRDFANKIAQQAGTTYIPPKWL